MYKEAERSIIKKYRKTIWRNFVKACQDYQMIEENDRICVCISGGKDSVLLAKCLQELQKYSKVKFELEFMVMDPGYNPENRQLIIDNCEKLRIPIKIVDSDIFSIVENIDDNPCYLCARMRRGFLYNNAQLLNCNKIALGHHFDDVIETVLMSMFYGSEFKTMLPKLKSTNFKGMELIRPLYLVKEESIISWKKHNNLEFLQCACKLTESINIDDKKVSAKRHEIKNLIKELKKVNPNVDQNIFTSCHNVNMNAICGYRKDMIHHSYLEDYNSSKE